MTTTLVPLSGTDLIRDLWARGLSLGGFLWQDSLAMLPRTEQRVGKLNLRYIWCGWPLSKFLQCAPGDLPKGWATCPTFTGGYQFADFLRHAAAWREYGRCLRALYRLTRCDALRPLIVGRQSLWLEAARALTVFTAERYRPFDPERVLLKLYVPGLLFMDSGDPEQDDVLRALVSAEGRTAELLEADRERMRQANYELCPEAEGDDA